MKEVSLLLIKILTYQLNDDQIVMELLLTICLLIFLMVALFKIWKIVKKSFQDSLYRRGDDEYIDLEEMEVSDEH